MPTIKQVESAATLGQAKFDRWYRRWNAQFYKPEGDAMVRMLLASMNPEQREMVRGQNPDAYEEIAKNVGWKEDDYG